MRHGATRDEVDKVISVIEELGYQAQPMPGAQRTAVGLVGNDGRVDASRLEGLPGVAEVIHVSQPYKQVSREWKSENTIVRLPGAVGRGGGRESDAAPPARGAGGGARWGCPGGGRDRGTVLGRERASNHRGSAAG